MGSLMAGWQTNPMNAKEALKRSTSSVTREEVDRFRRMKKELMEAHLADIQRDANQARSLVVPASPSSDSESGFSHAGSPPITPTTPSPTAAQEFASAKSPGWWQKSYWAFLNEPPILEDRQNRYVAQYNLGVPVEMDSDAPANTQIQHTRSSIS